MAPLDHLPVDDDRVEVVVRELSVLMAMDDSRSRAWARRLVQALDRHDAAAHIADDRGQLGWDDETDPDE